MKSQSTRANRFLLGSKCFGCLTLFISVVLLSGCNRAPIPDAKLKTMFDANRGDFDKLVSMAEQDRKIIRIRSDLTLMDTDTGVKKNVGLSEERWEEYRTIFRKLGIADGLERTEKFPTAIFFYVYCEGSAIDADCKGFAYSEKPLAPLASSVDDPQDGTFFKPLYPNWYLFRWIT